MKKTYYTIILCSLFFSNLLSQSLFDIETLRSINIDFLNSDWDSTLVANWHSDNGERELATLEMDGIIYDSVAVRYKGNATFYWADETNNPKKPLNIDMNDFVSGQNLLGSKKIKLASSMFDPSVLRDVLGFKIYRDYMPSPEANWMKVSVEGEYLGVYPNTQAINKQFLNQHFDYNDGVLIKCDPAAQYPADSESSDLAWLGTDSTLYYSKYDLKSDNGWAEMVNLMDILNNSPEDLESVLNIDRVLWYLAVSTVTANYDSYNGFYMHNYYLYLHENGLFQILPWDVSEIFIGSLIDNGIVQGDEMYEWDIFNQSDPFEENRPLVDFVVGHLLYKKQYLAHIRTVLEEVLNEEELLETCLDMQSIISEAVADDNNAYFGLGDAYFESNITMDMNEWGLQNSGIIPSVVNRKLYLQNHPEVSLLTPVISQVNRSIESPQVGEQVSISAMIEYGTVVHLMITTNEFASHFEAYPMVDDGMHEDGEAGDGIYGSFIPFSNLDDEIKYYIRAQNDDAMMLDPQRAEYEFHEYVVGQITSITELSDSQKELIITPNPFENQVSIHLRNENCTGEVMLQIYSVSGVLIKEDMIQFVDEQYCLELETLKSGVYFLKVDGYVPSKLVKN
ncbi:MAG: hypothetical protein ACI8XB_001504 [Patiriisocius sp.]|jgi:hypothetical protein